MYKYSAMGFSVDSELEFPEMLHSNTQSDSPDVMIRFETFDSTPYEMSRITKTISFLISDQDLFLSVDKVADFKVSKNCEILINPLDSSPDLQSIRSLITGTLLVFIAINRNFLPFHASAIIHHHNLMVFAGRSGAGKSTTIAGLASKGFQIFSDDIVLLSDQEGQITGKASYPMIKLWENSIALLGSSASGGKQFKIKAGVEKYGILLHEKFTDKTYPLNTVFIIKLHNGTGIKVKKLSYGEAFLQLTEHIHRPMFLDLTQMQSMVFPILTKIAGQADVYEILRPVDCPPMDLIAEANKIITDSSSL